MTAEPETPQSIPAMAMRGCSASSKGATMVRTSEWSVVDRGAASSKPSENVRACARASAESRARVESASSRGDFAERALKPTMLPERAKRLLHPVAHFSQQQ